METPLTIEGTILEYVLINKMHKTPEATEEPTTDTKEYPDSAPPIDGALMLDWMEKLSI
jgi:hypothetical protein